MPKKSKRDTGPNAETPTEQETEVTRRVRIKLDRKAEEEALAEMLEVMHDRDGVLAAKAEANKAYRTEIQEKDAKINELRDKLELGEWGEHACRQIMDLKKKTVRVILIATGDEIENRPMTEEERQATLF